MKKLIKMSIIVVISLAFCLKVSADDYSDEQLQRFEDILPESLSGITEDTDALLESLGISALAEEIIAIIRHNSSRVIALFLSCLGLGALMALSASISNRLGRASLSALGAITSLTVFSYIGELFFSAKENLTELCGFFSSAIPIFTAVSVSSGAVGTASVQAMGMNFTLSLISGVGVGVMLLAVGMGLSLAMLSFFGDERVGALSGSVSGFFKWLVGISTTLIIATFSLQSVVASASDGVAMRAAKYAASGMIPVVGGAVSGALSTLMAGLSYVRGIIGAGSVVAVVSIALAPLVIMLLYRAALSLSGTLCALFDSGGAVKIFGAYKTALDSLIAVYALSACVILFEIILFMKSGVTVF